MTAFKKENLILLTGASGYIGGSLLNELDRSQYKIRCLARHPEYLKVRVGRGVEVVKGDVFDRGSLLAALNGVHTTYYMIHSLAAKGSFAENDRRAAETFGSAAKEAGVQRIIYLGGLGEGPNLSEHLASRQEVGQILRESTVQALEFRASIVIGPGSLSFEMVRSLVEELPVMTTPRWVRSLAQPIAIEDVISYLIAALGYQGDSSAVFQIGGADQVSYEGIMRAYARARGLNRLIIPVPVLSPGLSSLWLALVTPLYFQVGRQLIKGVKNETVITDNSAEEIFQIKPIGIHEAIRRALEGESQEFAETRWSNVMPAWSLDKHWGGVRFGTRRIDSRKAWVSQPPDKTFIPIQRIGGETGWYGYDWLWSLRGLIDQLLRGVGKRRRRRDPLRVLPGDVIDFWRAEAVERNKLLRLRSEMKLPGRAWLQFEVEKEPNGSRIRQTAIFDPIGLFGLLYWYLLYPAHSLIFRRMLRKIVSIVENG
jgi:uncharacterized protein YbjT (DUF2867 family)